MNPRRPLTQKQKEELLKKQGGRCAVKICRAELKAGRFEDDHHQARIFSGGEELANRRLICIRCHRAKTKREQKANAHGKRIKYGRTRRGPPMPGTRASGWKHNWDGTWERR